MSCDHDVHLVIDLSGFDSWQDAHIWLPGYAEAFSIGRDPGRPPIKVFVKGPWPRECEPRGHVVFTWAHKPTDPRPHRVRYRSQQVNPIGVVCVHCGREGILQAENEDALAPWEWHAENGVQVQINPSLDLTKEWDVGLRDVEWR